MEKPSHISGFHGGKRNAILFDAVVYAPFVEKIARIADDTVRDDLISLLAFNLYRDKDHCQCLMNLAGYAVGYAGPELADAIFCEGLDNSAMDRLKHRYGERTFLDFMSGGKNENFQGRLQTFRFSRSITREQIALIQQYVDQQLGRQ